MELKSTSSVVSYTIGRIRLDVLWAKAYIQVLCVSKTKYVVCITMLASGVATLCRKCMLRVRV